MREKFNIIIFIFVLITTSILAEEEYDLGEKEVIGEDKQNYKEEIELKQHSIESEDLFLDEDLELKDTFEEDEYEVVTESIDLETNEREFELNYNINLYSKPKDAKVVVEDKKSMKGNYLTFGVGGYNNIDAFKYIYDYTKQETENLTYFLHIGREIRGEDRGNDDQSVDNYYGQIWYNNLNSSISHIIKDESLPGKTGMNVNDSFRKTKETKLEASYETLDNDLVLDTRINYTDVNSNKDIRKYSQYLLDIGAKYNIKPFNLEILNGVKNQSTLNFNYYIDKLDDSQITSIKMLGSDTISFNDFEDWRVNAKAGIELLIDNKNEQNQYLGLDIIKKVDENLNLNFGIVDDKFYDDTTVKLNNFELDDDIITEGLLDLEIEEEIGLMAGIEYNKDDYYVNANINHKIVKNKVIYYQEGIDSYNNDSVDDETVIKVDNANDNKAYQELELIGGYTYKDYRGKLTYKYNNLSGIPFSHQNEINMDLIYEKEKFKVDLEGKYVSDTYGKTGEKEKLPSYKTVNLYNSYDIRDSITLNLNFLNLLNVSKQIKDGYPKPSRKVMMEIKIKY